MVSDLRDEYKSTELGKVPKEWRVEGLSDISRNITIGLVKTMTAHYTDEGTPLIRNSDIKENKISKEKMVFLNENFAKENEGKRLLLGDVITVHTGDIGTSAVITKDLVGAHGFATLNTRPNIEVIDPYYLSWYFNSYVFKKQAYTVATGDGRSNLNLKDFINTKIVFPRNIREQKKITSILSVVNEAIEKTGSIIKQIQEVKKGLIQQLFSKGIGHTNFKKTEIGEIPANWEVKDLEDVLKKIVGGGTPSRKVAEFYTGQIPWVTVKDMSRIELDDALEHITEEAIRGSATNLIPTGTVIVATRIGLGRALINKVDVAINQDLKALIIDESLIYNRYLLWWYISQAEAIEAMGSGTTVKGIRLEQLKKLQIPLPNREEQVKIVNMIDLWQQKIKVEQQKLLQLQVIKEGLMQSLLTGQVRVNVEEEEVAQV